MMHVLPILEEVKENLRVLVFGIASNSTHEPPQEKTQFLAHQTLEELNEIRYIALCCAACVLHPGLSTSNFIPRRLAENCRSIPESLV